ncbi:hypothetical protein COB72_00295 [bacterium]|nr:MAG: hypothetical protein COB72_00295 [bacterium]
MGGSGSGYGYRSISPEAERELDQQRAKENERLNTEVNQYLGELLAVLNSRDPKLVNDRLDALVDSLGDSVEIDKMLLGGSVAKHTAVDGLSDVDAVVVLDREDLKDKSPDEVRDEFYSELDKKLDRSDVKAVQVGDMAVTIEYRDGMEIQLIPAIQMGNKIKIGLGDHSDWVEVNPKKFQSALTNANKKMNNSLVPAIKLLKSINADMPQQKQLKSYHIEALAVDASKSYSGPTTTKEVLIHLVGHASNRVLRPIKDISGQSKNADEYLGAANDQSRRIMAQGLAGIKRRLEAASTLSQWKAMFSD